MIKSWWGIGFPSHDGGVRIAMDTRTGNANYSGRLTIGGITMGSRINRLFNMMSWGGNWNGAVFSYQFYVDQACNIRIQGVATAYATSVGGALFTIRLYNYDNGLTYYISVYKFFNINYNHETLGVSRVEPITQGSYQVYVYINYNLVTDDNDYIYLEGTTYEYN